MEIDTMSTYTMYQYARDKEREYTTMYYIHCSSSRQAMKMKIRRVVEFYYPIYGVVERCCKVLSPKVKVEERVNHTLFTPPARKGEGEDVRGARL